jgi:hypothetical protein
VLIGTLAGIGICFARFIGFPLDLMCGVGHVVALSCGLENHVPAIAVPLRGRLADDGHCVCSMRRNWLVQ